MARGPVCKRCPIATTLKDLTFEYKWFIGFMEEKDLNVLTDHARGYCHGQLAFVHDAIDDIESLIPYLAHEAKLRAKSDKGL